MCKSSTLHTWSVDAVREAPAAPPAAAAAVITAAS